MSANLFHAPIHEAINCQNGSHAGFWVRPGYVG
jgi:hypothetical protein